MMRAALFFIAVFMAFTILPARGAFAACTSPAGEEGAREWFAADLNFRVCDGTNWNLFGTSIPGGYKGISAGHKHTCAIKSDMTLMCWGSDTYGEIGNETITGNQTAPVRVAGWQSVAGGYDHMCGVKTDNTAWCWGDDTSGQLGNGATTGNQVSPSLVSGGLSWASVEAGGYRYTCGITTAGAGYCWGNDSNGRSGNGATGNTTSPTAISGGGTWLSIDPGNGHACGIKSDGTLWCWGADTNGQVGNGATTGDQQSPVQIGAATWKVISAGGNDHTCGIQSNDTLWCWGNDTTGEVGNGATTGDITAPVQIGVATWKDVQAGFDFTCAIKSDNTLWCWGSDTNLKQGNGATAGSITAPAQIDAGSWKILSDGQGDQNACAIKSDDTLWCWGDDVSGKVGNGAPLTDEASPVLVSGGGAYTAIEVGAGSLCGIRDDYSMWCWGDDTYGNLGDDTYNSGDITSADPGYEPAPVTVSGGGGGWKKLALGGGSDGVSKYGGFSCGIASDDTAWCWGRDEPEGPLGDTETYRDRAGPVPVDGGYTWSDISAAFYFACGIRKSDSQVMCWGSDNAGEMGNGATTGEMHSPALVSGGLTFKSLGTAYFQHICGITTANALYCWGQGTSGEMGDGSSTNNTTPGVVSGGSTWISVMTGKNHTCGIKSDGTAWCWGADWGNQLGDATASDKNTPSAVQGGHNTFVYISGGADHTCALKSDGSLYCWGYDGNGQLGNGATGGGGNPTIVSGGHTWKTVSGGNEHTCAVKTDDTVYCWGRDDYGQVGNGSGSSADQTSPVLVSGGYSWYEGEPVSGTACSVTAQMDYVSGKYRFCDGSYYKNVICPAGGCGSLGACTTAGQIDWFTASDELAWCNGSTWSVMAR